MNRDTLYSSVVVDISEGAASTLPEAGGRYQTAMVVDRDHYIAHVFDRPGRCDLDPAAVGTSHVAIAARTFVDPADADDVAEVHPLQDGLRVEARSAGVPVHPGLPSEVPVSGFWSVSVYNAAGCFEPNGAGRYSINSVTAQRDPDGGATIHLGGDPSQPSAIPLPDGWDYTVRLYRPRPEILDGSWTFPAITRRSSPSRCGRRWPWRGSSSATAAAIRPGSPAGCSTGS